MMYKKYLVSIPIVMVLMLASVLPASAYNALQITSTVSPAVTATITSVGAYVPTVAPTNINSYACPTGAPVGYGTVTPDAVWGLICSQCLPYTPMPTSTSSLATSTPDIFASATPSPSPTVGATFTPTVNPSEGIFLWGGCNTGEGVSCEELAPNYWHFVQTNGHNNGNTFVRQQVGFNLSYAHDMYMLFHTINTEYTVSNSSPAQSPYWMSRVGFIESGGQTVSHSWLGAPTLDHGNPDGNTGFYTGSGVEKYTAVSLSVGSGVTSHLTGFNDVLGWNGVPNIQKAGLEWWVYLQPLYPPTTATPAPSGYCSVINGGDNALPDDDMQWTGIELGSNSCIDFGPVDSIDFGWLTASNIGIPWIAHLCFQEVNLGVITIFGVQVSLLIISYVLAIAWAVRNAFVS